MSLKSRSTKSKATRVKPAQTATTTQPNTVQPNTAQPLPTIPGNAAQLLLQVINENYVAAQQLTNHLKVERDCISKRDFEGHKVVLAKKNECISSLAQAGQHLTTLFKKLGVKVYDPAMKDFDPAKIDELISRCPSPQKATISNNWNALKKELATCQHLNSINSRIVHHSKKHVGRLLSIIKGHDQRTNLYQADGQSKQKSATRSLARA